MSRRESLLIFLETLDFNTAAGGMRGGLGERDRRMDGGGADLPSNRRRPEITDGHSPVSLGSLGHPQAPFGITRKLKMKAYIRSIMRGAAAALFFPEASPPGSRWSSHRTDAEALCSDWERAGQDIRKAMMAYERAKGKGGLASSGIHVCKQQVVPLSAKKRTENADIPPIRPVL